MVYNSKIYAAGSIGVSTISNGIVNKFSAIPSLHRISYDSYGYFAQASWSNSKVYIYDSNMKYTNKSIAFAGVNDARFDTNQRFVICSEGSIKIYS